MAEEGFHHACSAAGDEICGGTGWLLAAFAFDAFGGHVSALRVSVPLENPMVVVMRGKAIGVGVVPEKSWISEARYREMDVSQAAGILCSYD